MMAIPYEQRVTVAVGVRDLERAAAFYRDTLELKQTMFAPEMNWASFETGVPGCQIGMGQLEEEPQGRTTSISLGVTDLDAARRALEAKGVQFQGDNMEVHGQVRLAEFKDPDNNGLMLIQMLNPEA